MSVTLAAVPDWAAILPLGAYLLSLGAIHLRRRPVVVPGMLDLAALAAGLSGLVLAGPLALLQPAVGTALWATAMLLGGLVLILTCGLLATRPRLVFYNVTPDQLRPVLAEVVGRLDASARWAGESVVLPSRGLQLLLDGRGLARAVSVVAVGSPTSSESWTEFARRLRRAARKIRVRRNPWGAAAVLAGLGLVAGGLAWAAIGLWPTSPAAAGDPGAGLPSHEQAAGAPVASPPPGFAHARARRSLGA